MKKDGVGVGTHLEASVGEASAGRRRVERRSKHRERPADEEGEPGPMTSEGPRSTGPWSREAFRWMRLARHQVCSEGGIALDVEAMQGPSRDNRPRRQVPQQRLPADAASFPVR